MAGEEYKYKPFYCEENIWHLCNDRQLDGYVIFISNENRAVPLWFQKNSQPPIDYVVWDYHVIFAETLEDGVALVYDFDTLLEPLPMDFSEYASLTFRLDACMPAKYRRMFRVIDAKTFLAKFASDRSHMRGQDGSYTLPPPSWPKIKTEEETNNLQSFIDMTVGAGPGQVVDLKGLCGQLGYDFDKIET